MALGRLWWIARGAARPTLLSLVRVGEMRAQRLFRGRVPYVSRTQQEQSRIQHKG